ncbi:MAG: hypothetical protein JWR19_3932 [Pedosphaera sp.]|jgi:hypothetical protein|nr:hypothetical protein [Pedosphaera sp.]
MPHVNKMSGKSVSLIPMIKPSLLKPVLLLSATSLLFTGCVVHEVRYIDRPPVVVGQSVQDGVVVTEAPPAPVQEEILVSPGPAYVWIPGVWVWRGHWVWERGHYNVRPRAGAVWVPHRYVYRGGVHVFIRGGWR